MSIKVPKKNKYKIMRNRKLIPIPAFWNGKSQSSKMTEEVHGLALRNWWQYVDRNNYASFYLEEEWANIEKHIGERIIKDKKYTPAVYALQKARGKFLVATSKKIHKHKLADFGLERLLAEYENLEASWINFDHVNVPPWLFGGEYLQKYLRKQLESLGVTEEEVGILLMPSKLSFSAEEELEILKVALKMATGERTEKAINALVKKYHWIPFGYDGPDLYDAEYYEKNVREIVAKINSREIRQKIKELENYVASVKEKQKKLFVKYKLSKELQRLLGIAHTLSEMTDKRKEYQYQAHVAFHKIIKGIAEALNFDPLILKYVTFEEIKEHQATPKKIVQLGEKRMDEGLLLFWRDSQFGILTGKRAKKIFDEAMGEITGSDGLTLKGSVGSKGSVSIVKGIVRILHSPKEMDQLKDGEILVTAMTTPEYVPAMRRSLAIITDEGGVTCHAAIVSRELGKPAIIGTKIATKFLKNGELIEIDMEKGTIKKLAQ